MRRKSLLNNKTLVVGVIVILFASIFISSMNMSIVNPGWEIYNQIAGINYGGGPKVGPNDFPYPVTIGSSNWIVDEDEPNWGSPTIMIQSSTIRHVDMTGNVIPASQPATLPIEKTINNKKYVVDQHIYMFDITVRTLADVAHYTESLTIDHFEHETSWSKTTDAIIYTDHQYDGHVGKPFNGGVYTKFVINPWSGLPTRETPEGYQLNGAWAGVMGATIFTKEQGQVENKWGEKPNPSMEAPIYVRGGLDHGAQVNMYEDAGGFGTPAPVIPWDPNQILDARIQSAVVLYLPVELQAGAYLTKNFAGVTDQLTPCDAYIKYTVRVDVLQAHEYILVTNPIPPTLDPPTDFLSWAKGFWDALFDPTSPTFWILIVILILAILIVIYKLAKGGKSETKDDTSYDGSGGSGGSGKVLGLKFYHWIVIGGLLILGVIPDPTDLLDFGLPIIEPLLAGIYYIIVKPKRGS